MRSDSTRRRNPSRLASKVLRSANRSSRVFSRTIPPCTIFRGSKPVSPAPRYPAWLSKARVIDYRPGRSQAHERRDGGIRRAHQPGSHGANRGPAAFRITRDVRGVVLPGVALPARQALVAVVVVAAADKRTDQHELVHDPGHAGKELADLDAGDPGRDQRNSPRTSAGAPGFRSYMSR